MNEKQIYSLCEAIADISYIAGYKQYYSGDSREDIANFISWGKEFEEKYSGVDWGVDPEMEYIEAISEFTEQKIKL